MSLNSVNSEVEAEYHSSFDFSCVYYVFLQMTIEMYPSDQVADLRAEVTHWYENLQKEQMNQQAQLQEFGQSGRQPGDFPGQLPQILLLLLFTYKQTSLDHL